MHNPFLNQAISSDTLNQLTLLVMFSSVLEVLVSQNGGNKKHNQVVHEAKLLALQLQKNPDNEFAQDDIQYVLEDVERTIDEYVPETHYFGAHEGDGACFGFWEVAC